MESHGTVTMREAAALLGVRLARIAAASLMSTLVLAITPLGTQSQGLGARTSRAAGQTAPCALIFYGGREACYAPRQVAAAEKLMTVRPVNPSSLASAIAGLRLTNVIVVERASGTPLGIYYVFGTISGGSGTIPLPAPSEPKFLVIFETSTQSPRGPWHLTRTIGHTAAGALRYDPWNFDAQSLRVVGNLAKQQMRRLGVALLQRAASR